VHNNQAVTIDLCADHAKPLEELIERLVLASPRAPGYSTSPHRCEICKQVLSRRSHAIHHVQRQHGYSEAGAYIRPVGERRVQPTDSPAHQPHRCKVCKKPYFDSSTAKQHVLRVHADKLQRGRRPVDFVQLIED
jgi:uncharacterized C2H2 Zn-finger protein